MTEQPPDRPAEILDVKVEESLSVPAPLQYEPKLCKLAEGLLMIGMDRHTCARTMGVRPDTFNNWVRRHPEFREAVQRGATLCDTEVVRSLYERACGVKVMLPNGEEAYKIPPDTTACIFWLKNRQRQHWRDRVDHNVTANGEKEVVTASRDELIRELEKRGQLTNGSEAVEA